MTDPVDPLKYRSKGKEILLFYPTWYVDFYIACCVKGGLFKEDKYFDTLEEAEASIKKLLKRKVKEGTK